VKIRSLLLAVYLVLPAGCAEMPLLQDGHGHKTWQAHLDEIGRLTDWSVKGRVSVVTAEASWTATMHWHQADERYQMKLIAPFGQGTYRLEGNNETASIRTAKNTIHKADTLGDLLFDQLSPQVRPAVLGFWIKGIPDPETSANELLLTENALLSSMEQHGFRVSISRYQGIDDKSLPRKISISSDTIKLKMVLQNWTI